MENVLTVIAVVGLLATVIDMIVFGGDGSNFLLDCVVRCYYKFLGFLVWLSYKYHVWRLYQSSKKSIGFRGQSFRTFEQNLQRQLEKTGEEIYE